MAKDSNEQKYGKIASAAIVRWGLLALALTLIVWGAIQGDALMVLRKAALICYECIGIG